ncbi:MAG: S41 family peptidase [Flavisolibacter sp.]
MRNILGISIVFILSNCAVSKKFNPATKYSPQQLRTDYTIFRKVLEESHPGLYWYTPKDSLDYYFDWGALQIKDSLSEIKFRNLLSYVLAGIKCGHTTVRASSNWSKHFEPMKFSSFPLNIKLWPDTAVVVSSLNTGDATVSRGDVLQSIDGMPMRVVVDSFFHFLSADGFNTTHKYQTLSNPGVFRSMYNNIFGVKQKVEIAFMDTSGIFKKAFIPYFNPQADSQKLKPPTHFPSLNKKLRREILLRLNRTIKYDTLLHTGFMELNSFSKGNKLRGFFRKAFRKLNEEKITDLVIDLRGNGGGSVVLSNLLTRYIAEKPFKILDSLYALKRSSKYGRYQQGYLFNHLFLMFMTHKRSDGNYHFTYFEKKYFKPKKKTRFKGMVYILTSGNTFSAATIFCKTIERQDNVTIVGEETGGGAYGNNAWLIPDIILPNTKVRFRLPLFRMVVDKDEVKGRGVVPTIQVNPSVRAIRRNIDFKMEKLIEMIRQKSNLQK